MKATTLILAALIPFSFWMGCKDNAMDPLGGQNSENQNYTNSPVLQTEREPLVQQEQNNRPIPIYQLVWSQDELTVNTGDESGSNALENSVSYSEILNHTPASYIISFDAYTNADRWSNGYSALAQITRDEQIIFQEYNFPVSDDGLSYHQEITLENTMVHIVTFYVSLFQSDRVTPVPAPVTVTLYNIKIFKAE